MKIVYLTCVYPPYPGGIGVAAQGMAGEMTQRGYDVSVFTSLRQPMLHDSGFMIHALRPWFRWGNAALIPQFLWRLRDFDIVHVLYPFYGAAEFVPLIKRRTRAKIVVHHLMDAVASGALGAFFRWHAQHFMPRIFRAADRVLVLSEDYARNSEIAKLGVQWEVVPHGIDTTLFKPMIHDSRFMIPTILFVGGLDRAHYFKGVPVLLEACRILKDRGVKFLCKIAGEGEMRKEYERQAKAAGLMSGDPISVATEIGSPYIQFFGLVPHEELPTYYQRAAVAVVPSTERIECFSIVAAEAQACGIPAIVTDFPGVRVTIEDGVTGLVARPGDAQDLADKIQMILDSPAKSAEIGKAGRKRAESLYSWKVVGNNLDKIYKNLVRT